MDSAAPLCAALLLVIYGVAPCRCACSNISVAGAQLDALLAEYDREAPPAPHLVATLALDVRHASILEKSSTVRLVADLHMSWQDSRIKWNASEWGCDWALAAAERLWLPDVTLINAAAVADVDPLRARVTNTGAVSWAMRLDVTVPVTLQLAEWPEDVQTAVFRFASRELTEEQLEFTFKEQQAIMPYDSGAWEVVDAKSSNVESLAIVDDGAPSPKEAEYRALATWRVSLRRRSPAQATAARVAVAAALLMLLGAALLPPASRPPLAATAAFTLAVWLCGAAWRLPGGAEAPRSVLLCGGVCGAAGAAAAAAALVCRLARLSAPPPAALRRALAAAAALGALSPLTPAPTEGAGAGACSASGAGAWAAAARLLDAILLATLALVIVVLLCVYH